MNLCINNPFKHYCVYISFQCTQSNLYGNKKWPKRSYLSYLIDCTEQLEHTLDFEL